MEVLGEDELIIRNVETDLRVGSVMPNCIDHPHNPDCQIVSSCTVYSSDDEAIATISNATVQNPLGEAAVAVANHEAYYGYPGLKAATERTPDPHRGEFRLGTVLADAVSVIARATREQQNGGVKTETKEKCSELLVQLHNIWYVTRFGSFDGGRRSFEPYFANTPASAPRMSFAAAAQHYGIWELRRRFPDLSETILKAVLSWPLNLLSDLLTQVLPLQLNVAPRAAASRRTTIP
jgi:hypothetical protein